MASLFRRLRFWLRRARFESELREEIELHRLMTQERLEAQGVSPREAHTESWRRMGNVTLARERSRDSWSWPTVDTFAQDAVYAIRQFRRAPGFSLLAVGTLALGIGLNTTAFNIYSALALRPWPVAEPDRVVQLFNRSERDLRQRPGGAPGGFSLDEAAYFATHARTLSGVVTIRSGGGNQRLAGDDAAVSWVGGSYFDVLGVPMSLGRGFTPADDRPAQPSAVAVLSHGYWTRAFGGDRAIVGRDVRFEDISFVVLGVTAKDFTGTSPDRVDLWMPMASARLLRPTDRWVRNIALKPENCCVAVAARLAPGVTRGQAAAELHLLDVRYRAEHATTSPNDGVRVTGTEIMSDAKNDAGRALRAMFTGVSLILLLACANVGNLLIARAFARRREIAVRLALGASRRRIIRQLLTEGLLLAAVAAVAGVWLTMWITPLVVSTVSETAMLQLTPDGPLLGYAIAVTLLTCVVFAIAPALHATRAGVAIALKDGGPEVSPRFRLRGVLAALQVGAVVVLMASAGLLFRAVSAASSRDFGYDMHALSIASIDAPPRGYEPARVAAISAEMAESLGQFRDGRRITLVSTPPMASGNIKGAYRLPGSNEEFFNGVYEVAPSYFDVTGVRIVAGRGFEPHDRGRHVIVINETMARRHWSVDSAVGQHVVTAPPEGGWNMPGELEIIGVARDAYMASLTTVDATIYQPLSGRSVPHAMWQSTDNDAGAAVKEVVTRIDPRLRLRVAPLSANLQPRLRGSQTAALLAAFLGAIAIAVAGVGLFGLFAFSVHHRTHEIGIRVALGAKRANVVAVIVASHGVPLIAGLVGGGVGSIAASRLLRSYLLGLSPGDPLAFAGVVVVLAAAAAGAMYFPARRAATIDPVLALRHE